MLSTMAVPCSRAVIANREGQDSQAFLSTAAAEWRDAGLRVAGVLAEDNEAGGTCSAGFLRDIASGRKYSVHLETPPVGATCHLDASGMDNACTGLLGQIASVDIVLFSKFGKLEATRKGLWPAFSAAVAAGKPLLTTVSPKHFEAWKAFAPDAAWLDADVLSIEQWRRAATSQPGMANPADRA
jgi:nucleoside-triphosphatase THEP1